MTKKQEKPVLSQNEVHALLKGIEGGDFEDEFNMPDLDDSEPELRSKELENDLDKLLIKHLHPDAPIKEIKRIGWEVYRMFNESWEKAKKAQKTKKKIQQCFKER